MASHLSHLRNAFVSFAAGFLPAWHSIDFVLTPDGAFPTFRTAIQRSDELLKFLQRSGIDAVASENRLWSVKRRPPLGVLPHHWLLQDGVGRLFLAVVRQGARLDPNRFAADVGLEAGQLSAVSENILRRVLNTDRESLSVLSVFNDAEGRVTVAIDRSLMNESALRLHALTRRRSVVMHPDQLATFLTSVNHLPHYLSAACSIDGPIDQTRS